MARASKVADVEYAENSAARFHIDIKIERWPLRKLIPQRKQSRIHSNAQIGQIAASMEEFGITNPILVERDGLILAGTLVWQPLKT